MSMWPFCVACSFGAFITYQYFDSYASISLLAVAIAGAFYHGQDKLLYQPNMPENSREYVENPNDYGINEYESIFLTTDDGVQLHAFLLKHPQSRGVLFVLHGNAGNIGHRLVNAKMMLTKCKLDVFLLDYRGYGKSEGEENEEGLYLDAQAGMKYLLQRSDIRTNRIIMHGRSLGGAVAIHLATETSYAANIHALVLENTFTSIPDIGRVLFPPLEAVINAVPLFLVKNKFSRSFPPQLLHQFTSYDRIARLVQPTLFISGEADTLVPPSMMRQLYQRCGSVLKEFRSFPRGEHNDTWTQPGYAEAIVEFLAQLEQVPSR